MNWFFTCFCTSFHTFLNLPLYLIIRSTMSVFYTNCKMHTFSCITMQYLLNCYCVITWCDTSIFFFRTIFGNRRLYILQKIKIDFMTDSVLDLVTFFIGWSSLFIFETIHFYCTWDNELDLNIHHSSFY